MCRGSSAADSVSIHARGYPRKAPKAKKLEFRKKVLVRDVDLFALPSRLPLYPLQHRRLGPRPHLGAYPRVRAGHVGDAALRRAAPSTTSSTTFQRSGSVYVTCPRAP